MRVTIAFDAEHKVLMSKQLPEGCIAPKSSSTCPVIGTCKFLTDGPHGKGEATFPVPAD